MIHKQTGGTLVNKCPVDTVHTVCLLAHTARRAKDGCVELYLAPAKQAMSTFFPTNCCTHIIIRDYNHHLRGFRYHHYFRDGDTRLVGRTGELACLRPFCEHRPIRVRIARIEVIARNRTSKDQILAKQTLSLASIEKADRMMLEMWARLLSFSSSFLFRPLWLLLLLCVNAIITDNHECWPPALSARQAKIAFFDGSSFSTLPAGRVVWSGRLVEEADRSIERIPTIAERFKVAIIIAT